MKHEGARASQAKGARAFQASDRAGASERGAAVVMALGALSLLAALGVTMLLTSTSEMLIAGMFRDQRAAVYAADAIAARALDELAQWPDWNAVLAGSPSPSLVDGGSPAVPRVLDDGSTIALASVVNMANCQKASACTVAELEAVSARRPWGANNPRWQLYAYGPLRNVLPAGALASPWYVVLLVGDDPLRAADVIALRAEAFGPRSGHAVVEMLAARPSGQDTDYNGGGRPSMKTLSWREVR